MLLTRVILIFSVPTICFAKKETDKSSENTSDEDVTDMMFLGKNQKGKQRTPQNSNPSPVPTNRPGKGEVVVERFVETLMSSERYLQMIETIDKKLNHLDESFHERTNSLIKYLSEILHHVKTLPSSEMEDTLKIIRGDITMIRKTMSEKLDRIPKLRVDAREPHLDTALDARLSFLEGNVKNVMTGVDSIVSTINEVKNRPHMRTNAKMDGTKHSLETLSLISEFRRTLQEQKPRKCDCKSGRVGRAERYPTDCHEIQMQGFNVSGIYKIKPDDVEPFYVLCDLTTAGGGWTVFQNRFDGSQDFFKGWSDYKHGFGNLAGEFWLGLEKLHYLTNQKLYELRVELETQHGHEAYAAYSVFTIGSEFEGYRISTLGSFFGTAGDSLTYHAGQKFSTNDIDNDDWKEGSCAVEHGGAWWYKECDKSNLNGVYAITSEEHRGQTIYWISFKGPNVHLTKTKMMIRPLPARRPVDFADTPGKTLDNALEQVKPPRPGISALSKPRPDAFSYNQPPSADAFFNNYA